MGLKSEPRQSNRAPRNVPSGKFKQEQIMKQVVETTRCTHTEAEEALAECNYDLELAVNYIIDRNGDNVWTEQKNRKAKKTEVEEPVRSSGTRGGKRGGRGFSTSNREREGQSENRPEKSDGKFANRNGDEKIDGVSPNDQNNENRTDRRNRPYGNQSNRTGYEGRDKKMEFNNEYESGENRTDRSDRKFRGRGGRNGYDNRGDRKPEYTEGQSGQDRGERRFGGRGRNVYENKTREFVRSDLQDKPEPEVPAPSVVVPKEIPNKAGPLSYAALVAKGNQKPPQPPAPVAAPHPPVQPAAVDSPKEPSPVPEPKPATSGSEETQSSNNTEAKDIESATQSLTSQLKNDLGLSSHPASTATQNSPMISAASSSVKGSDKGQIAVEHAGAEHVSTSGYQFGPTDGQQHIPQAQPQPSQLSQPIKPEEQSYVPQNNVAAPDFSRSHENGLYKPQDPIVSKPPPMVPNPQMHPMGAYGVDNTQLLQNAIPRRNLGYAETNSVTIQPERPQQQQQQPQQQVIRETPVTTAPSYQSYGKAPVTAPPSMGHPQLGVHHQQNQHQQQMYNPMYNNFPYVNLYSPVAGREDQAPYANPYMPYQFGMDMNSLPHVIPHLPLQHQMGHQQHHQPQGGLSHQPQSGHRNDHIQTGYSDKMQSYGQSNATSNNTVGQNGQRENPNVPPPPGFSGPPGNVGNHSFTWRRFL